MERAKVYISSNIASLNQEKRRDLLQRLQAQGEVIEPEAIDTDSEKQRKADILRLISCNRIFMVTGWELSDKATLERDIAKGLNFGIEYETEPQHPEIKNAIKAVMGVPFRVIAEDSRNRWHVYARMIYAHHCKKAGENTKRIAEETRHDESSIGYYLRHYESEYKYNREFHKAAEKVATLLSEKLKAERQSNNE